MAKTIEIQNMRQGPGKQVILLPGWLGHGDDWFYPSQYRPLLNGALAKFPTVVAVDYAMPSIGVPSHIVAGEISARIMEMRGNGLTVTAIGSSLGAQMLIRTMPYVFGNVRWILVDPPAGAASLVKLKEFRATKLATKIGALPSWLNKGWAQHQFEKAFCSGLADANPIEIPKAVKAEGEEAVAAYIKSVRRSAYEGQQGFPLTLAAWQIGEMARAAEDHWYLEACRTANLRYGDNIVRVLSTRNNEVVDPSVSDAFYLRHLPDARRVVAETNHCDYAQRREFWNELLTPLL